MDEIQEKIKTALLAIKKLKKENAALLSKQNEPIAIIGTACRFPKNIDTPEKLWQLLKDGKDVIDYMPENRWNKTKYYDPEGNIGKMYVEKGGFINNPELFDNSFFEISPQEAIHIDPQLRILLEVTQEALERSGITPTKLRGKNAGVYIGVAGSDYAQRNFFSNIPERIDVYALSGISDYAKSGRISYFYDIHGPSFVVNTACSSSLTATYSACLGLQRRECSMALVGGTSVVTAPHSYIALSQMNAIDKNGICRPFDAKANGYSRGEGIGVLVLKRLSDAVEDGDPILGVIRGAYMNQDGRSNGFTAPNASAQAALLKDALDKTNLTPNDIDYIETHGTGTSLGDPIELEGLKQVYGTRSNSQQLVIGTIKANLGHTEGCAGVAGIIKALLCLQHKQFPKHLNFDTPNPLFDWTELPVSIPQKLTEWKKDKNQLRRAGISSFGVSGTNVHIIIEEPETGYKQNKSKHKYTSLVLPISAKSKEALIEYCRKYISYLSETDVNLSDICASAAIHREHFRHRIAFAGKSKQQFADKLRAYINHEIPPQAIVPKQEQVSVAFIFPGQGSQWIGMGKQLYKSHEVFQKQIDACDKIFKKYVGWSLVEELNTAENQNRFNEIDVIQPILFAIEIAIAKLWLWLGVTPTAVIGHSMGEIAAAYIAGALSLDNAAAIICLRSQYMKKMSDKGAMLVAEIDKPEADKLEQSYENKISVAVCNSPGSHVLAGNKDIIYSIAEQLEEREIFCRLVNVNVASHSRQMHEIKQPLIDSISQITPKQEKIRFLSTVTGDYCNGTDLTPQYWGDNLEKTVKYYQTIELAAQNGINAFIEISPHPVLHYFTEQTLQNSNVNTIAMYSLHRDRGDDVEILEQFGKLYSYGYNANWKKVYNAPFQFVQIPTYAWQRKALWLDYPEFELDSTEKTSKELPKQTPSEDIPDESKAKNLQITNVTDVNAQVRNMLFSVSGYGTDEIKDDDNLLLLGIDSLMLMKLRRMIQSEFNITIPVKNMLANCSIDAIAKTIFNNANNVDSEQKITYTSADLLDKSLNKDYIINKFAKYICSKISEITNQATDSIKTIDSLKSLQFDDNMLNELHTNVENELKTTIHLNRDDVNLPLNELAEKIINQIKASKKKAPDTKEKSISTNYKRISNWLESPNIKKDAKIRLFCFHPAGGTASLYHPWENYLHHAIELYAVQLPGRGLRIADEPYSNKRDLIKDLTDEIIQHTNLPFVFFGHCMGGMMAFEVVRELRKREAKLPEQLILSASGHPKDAVMPYKFHLMSDGELAEVFPGLDRKNYEEEEYYRLMLRIMRADIQLNIEYKFLDSNQPPLPIPFSVIAPTDDELAPMITMENWKLETDASFDLIKCTGGHHYINNATEFVTNIINKKISVNSK